MKNLQINNKVQQKLHEFEVMETISDSDNWDAQLNNKLYSKQTVKSHYSKNYGLALAALTLLNIGIMTYSFVGKSEKKETLEADFQLVSNELLIPSNY
jgi:hypothetical protein